MNSKKLPRPPCCGTQNALPLELWAYYTVLYGCTFDAAAMRAAILLGAAERIRAGMSV